jgi:positive regulator of sigma E activity
MLETAIVCEISEDRIKVIIDDECGESCLHCSKKGHKNFIIVQNKAGFTIKTGDRVEIYASPSKTILAGFFVFIMPLILFGIFYFTGKMIAESGNELIPFLSGIAGIGFGFLLNFFIKKIRKQEDFPEITKVYTH